MQKYIFFFLCVITLYSALMVLISKKPIHSIMYLILCFFTLAGHYILLNAQFLAVVHIIVYAGAIMVLFLFAVMLLNLNALHEETKTFWVKFSVGVSGLLLLFTLLAAIKGINMQVTQNLALTQIGMVKDLGRVLYNQYMYPFEISSVLFLSSMVGAVMLGKK